MTKTAIRTKDILASILVEYEVLSRKSIFKIAGEMGIELSNYYLYRSGRGNPTCKTIDKIITVIHKEHPEILRKWGKWYEE